MTKSKLTVSLTDLKAIADSIDTFSNLSVFGLLDTIPDSLTLDVFIVSKDNKHALAGTESVFRTNKDLVLSLALPDPIALVKPDKTKFKDLDLYMSACESFMSVMTDPDHETNIFNNLLASLTQQIQHFKLADKYSNFRRAVEFVLAHDPSQFVSNEPLKPDQLPSDIKTKILNMVRASFEANKYIVAKGKVQIEIPVTAIDLVDKKGEKLGSFIPNLDSLNNVLALIQWRGEYPYSQYGFYDKDLYLAIMQSVYKDCNCFGTVNNLASMLDVDYGSSKNTSTILESIAKLLM